MPRTGRAQPILGYPSRCACARELRRAGRSVAEISLLMSRASGEEISVKRVHSLLAQARVSAGGGSMAVAVSGPAYGVLAAAGRARGLQARGLAARLLEVIAADGMIDAVLDDGVASPAPARPEDGR